MANTHNSIKLFLKAQNFNIYFIDNLQKIDKNYHFLSDQDKKKLDQIGYKSKQDDFIKSRYLCYKLLNKGSYKKQSNNFDGGYVSTEPTRLSISHKHNLCILGIYNKKPVNTNKTSLCLFGIDLENFFLKKNFNRLYAKRYNSFIELLPNKKRLLKLQIKKLQKQAIHTHSLNIINAMHFCSFEAIFKAFSINDIKIKRYNLYLKDIVIESQNDIIKNPLGINYINNQFNLVTGIINKFRLAGNNDIFQKRSNLSKVTDISTYVLVFRHKNLLLNLCIFCA